MDNNKFKYGSVILIALLVTIGTLAFKNSPSSKKAEVTEWYTLTITGGDPDDTDNQMITAIRSEPTEASCNVSNSGDPCAVHLTSPNPLPLNISVEDAFDLGADYADGSDYAKEPQP